jgi:hypothetical protein
MTREFNIIKEKVLTVLCSLDGMLIVEGLGLTVYKIIFLT